jgi:eukaryotic-like serine/threonine-protein kinase
LTALGPGWKVVEMTAPGERIADRYELVAPLGEGGMGVVWRARDTRLGRAVAVKLLSATIVGSETARVRLIREARAAAALEHEGIIRVYDVGELPDGGAFLVMELVRGQSLRDLIEQAPLTPARCIRIVTQVAQALQLAHASGVVHRDIKPDNVMVRDGDRVIVVDFGVAKPVATEIVVNAETLAGVTDTTLTGAGQIVGTPAYLSPEQARGTDVGAATDQFALAVTAFEAMTGQRPWEGKSPAEVVASILRDPPASLRALVPSAPASLEAALVRALAKDPANRHADMASFADALGAAAADISGASLVMGPSLPVPSPATRAGTVSTNGGQATTAPPAVPQRRTWMVVLAMLGLAGVVTFAMRRSQTNDSTPAATKTPSTIACPQFEVTGVDAPFIGAAAAALACERVQLARGGTDSHTLTPAELAGAPRDVTPAFPSGLFDGKESRARSVEAARRSGSWLDGTLEKRVDAYVATVALRDADGTERARGEGHAVELFEAVRDALAPIVRSLPPLTREEAAYLEHWLDVGSVDDALALLDVRTAILVEDPESLRATCSALDGHHGLSPRALYLARSSCRKKLRTGPVLDEPPALDESTPGALITTSLARGTLGGPAAVRERARRLEQARDRETSAEGKARLSAAAAEVYNLIADERARDVARGALLASPKAVDWRASAWHRVAFSSSGDVALASAIVAWHPWEPISQSLWGVTIANDSAGHAISFERAYLLSRRGTYAYGYGTNLLERGNIEPARGVAELAHDESLRTEILLSEARYGAVLAQVPKLLAELPASDENAALAFRLAHQGVRASVILGRPADFVDGVVTRYVLSEPHHVIDATGPIVALVHACVLAPRAVGRRCIDRLEQLRRDAKLPGIFSSMDPILAGAARFVADDYAGAAKSWRTLLRAAGWVQGPLRDPLAIAFDGAGEVELAEEVDAPLVALVDLPRTADPAWVRAAKRAHKRGDVAQARKLARAVVDKWRFADEKVPAAQEMKDLLAKLPP